MPQYTYTILEGLPELGGGWHLRLYVDDEEVGGGGFPPEDDTEEAKRLAYLEAKEEGDQWVASR